MKTIVTKRETMLSALQKNKGIIRLSLEELREIDCQLANGWGIEFHPENSSFDGLLAKASDSAAVERFISASDMVAKKLVKKNHKALVKAESKLYEAMAHSEILGPVTSKRRHLILDSIAVGIGLSRHIEFSGSILDVGCNAGFVASILAEALNKTVIGIDPSPSSIKIGSGHKARSVRAELIEAAIPWQTDRRFDLILAIDSMPQSTPAAGQYLRGIANLLEKGGVAIIVSSYWAGADVAVTRRQLRSADLGFGYADIVGGYGDIPPRFDATGFLGLIKGSDRTLPRKITELMESEWTLFKNYANAPETISREMTQAFERASR